METQLHETAVLSNDALDYIAFLQESNNAGLNENIDFFQDVLIELIFDSTIGEDKNGEYIEYVASSIFLLKLLKNK
ncbi:MAG: hypothetical protein A2W90_15250 [Bacteroidetes bacterium GWF2_42_66]|nr:MAG: hypothetical protein A2W92_23680 [Bacteroidetes bacterium GWA2_42_15]OFX96853.1 MAG: hypothetical protein A2W89_19745 [Bacteroidetes bacterium GWE2_42_39]OFY46848.1 MAG: hypothetical protein A2W90_15250 [Bacteroidetes bacterium GWF2_42_66]HBL75110.1 hypothetical protein [Prolixibacteraceae bacterium]HCU60217.1 hypothetical protein [Prolixibacteraceae bacterium]